MDKEVKDQTAKEKTYAEVEYKGIIKDLQDERNKRQQIQFEADQSRRQMDALKQTIKDLEEKVSQKSEVSVSEKLKFEGKDEDYATVKDVKEGFTTLEKEATKKFQAAAKAANEAAKQEMLMEKFHASCQKAIEKYANRKDIGLDFETVYRAAVKLIGGNQYEEQAIFHSVNPGEALYKRGCEDPEIKMKLELEENQELLKDMGTRKVSKEILSGVPQPKSTEFFSLKEIAGMSVKEAQANLPKIEKSMEHWAKESKK
jgi:hypothetical protein